MWRARWALWLPWSLPRGGPQVLLAEMGRDSERTSAGRDNGAHGNLPPVPSPLLVLSNSWQGKAKPNP